MKILLSLMFVCMMLVAAGCGAGSGTSELKPSGLPPENDTSIPIGQ